MCRKSKTRHKPCANKLHRAPLLCIWGCKCLCSCENDSITASSHSGFTRRCNWHQLLYQTRGFEKYFLYVSAPLIEFMVSRSSEMGWIDFCSSFLNFSSGNSDGARKRVCFQTKVHLQKHFSNKNLYYRSKILGISWYDFSRISTSTHWHWIQIWVLIIYEPYTGFRAMCLFQMFHQWLILDFHLTLINFLYSEISVDRADEDMMKKE